MRTNEKRAKRESEDIQKRTKREPKDNQKRAKREFILHRDTPMVNLVKDNKRFKLVSESLHFLSQSILS